MRDIIVCYVSLCCVTIYGGGYRYRPFKRNYWLSAAGGTWGGGCGVLRI